MRAVRFARPDLSLLRAGECAVDMHFHTEHSFDCSTKVGDVVRLARELGVGVAITDHNEIRGVLEAARAHDLFLIPGIEVTTKPKKDLLVYFASCADLVSFYDEHIRPNLRRNGPRVFNYVRLEPDQLLDALREYDCLVAIAHPFTIMPKKSYPYFTNEGRRHLLERVDAIEVLNQTQKERANLAALGWAVHEDLGFIGGSDGHLLPWLGRAVTVAEAQTPAAFLDQIRKRANRVVGEQLTLPKRVRSYASQFTDRVSRRAKRRTSS